MLVLVRKRGQSITISHPDGDVRVIMCGVDPGGYNRAKIAVDAPRVVRVIRTEVLDGVRS